MTHLFVPYQESLELKELGFDESCLAWYNDKNIRISGIDGCCISKVIKNSEFPDDETVCCPTFSQAFKWFRKEHGLYHSIVPKLSYPDDHVTGIEWYANIMGGNGVDIGPEGVFDYEEAELACLRKLIQIVKTN